MPQISPTYLERTLYTPDMFGAVGDGTADDTAALAALIQAAFDDNKTIYITAGTYAISAPLQPRTKIQIFFDPLAKFIAAAAMPHMVNFVNELYPDHDGWIDGMQLDCANLADVGLRLYATTDHFRVSGVRVENATANSSAVVVEKCTALVCKSMRAYLCNGHGITFIDANACIAIGIRAFGCKGDGIRVLRQDHAGCMTLYSPVSEQNDGSGIVVATSPATTTAIVRPWLEANKTHGFHTTDSTVSIVDGNVSGVGVGSNHWLRCEGTMGHVHASRVSKGGTGDASWLDETIDAGIGSEVGPIFSSNGGLYPGTASTVSESLGEQLIANGSIETADLWRCNTVANGSFSTLKFHSGTQSFLKSGAINDYAHQRNVVLRQGKTYRFSAWVYSDAVGGVRFRGYHAVAANAFGSGYETVAGQWIQIVTYFRPPEVDDDTSFHLGVADFGTPIDFYIDDVELREVVSHELTSTVKRNGAFSYSASVPAVVIW